MQRSKHARSVTVCVTVSLPVKLLGFTKVYDYRLQKYCDLEVFWVYQKCCLGAWDYTQQNSSALAQITFSKQRTVDTCQIFLEASPWTG